MSYQAYKPRRWRGYYQTWETAKVRNTPIGQVTFRVLTVLREERNGNRERGDIPWDVLQTIKDEILGPDALAIEVYPPKEEIVADEYRRHLWVIPEELRAYLPCSIFK